MPLSPIISNQCKVTQTVLTNRSDISSLNWPAERRQKRGSTQTHTSSLTARPALWSLPYLQSVTFCTVTLVRSTW